MSTLREKILVPVDGSELSDSILGFVRGLAVPGRSEVTILQAVKKSASWDVGSKDGAPRRSRRHVDNLERTLSSWGVATTGKVVFGDAAEKILEHVRQEGTTLVAMSTHARTGIDRWVRGSVAERVLRECPVPVFLGNPFCSMPPISEPPGRRFRRILVPLDGSPLSASVLPHVREIAEREGAEVLLLHATPPHETEAEEESFLSRIDVADVLEEYRRQLGELAVRVLAVTGDPASTILSTIDRERADLLAMATHGRTGISRWAFGSTAESVLRECRCPLLVVRHGVPVEPSPRVEAEPKSAGAAREKHDLKSIAILTREHETIEEALEALVALAERLHGPEPVSGETAERLVHLVRKFVDDCHHAKEESVLFPALETAGLSHVSGLLAVLREQHEEAHSLVTKLVDAAAEVGTSEDARTRLARAAIRFADLMEEHLEAEELSLFPAAEKLLSSVEDARIAKEFERFDAGRPGRDVRDELHEELGRLAATQG